MPAIGCLEVGLVAVSRVQAEGVVVGVLQGNQIPLVIPGSQPGAVLQARVVEQAGIVLAQAIKNRKPVVCHHLARHAVAQFAWYARRRQAPSGC